MPLALVGLLLVLAADLWLAKKFKLFESVPTDSQDQYWRQTIEKKKSLETYLEDQVQEALDKILGSRKAVVRVNVLLRMQEEQFEDVNYEPQKLKSEQTIKTDKTQEDFADQGNVVAFEEHQKKLEKQLKESLLESSKQKENQSEEGGSQGVSRGGGSDENQGALPGLLYAPEQSYLDQDLPGFPKVFSYDEQSAHGDNAFESVEGKVEKGVEGASTKETLEIPSSLEKTSKEKTDSRSNKQFTERTVQEGGQDQYVFNTKKYKKVIPPGEILRLSVNLAIKDAVLERLGDRRFDLERYVKSMVGFDPARQDEFVLIPYSQTTFAERFSVFWRLYRFAILTGCGIFIMIILGIFGTRAYANFSEKKRLRVAESTAAAKQAELEATKQEKEEKEAVRIEEQEKLRAKREAILQMAQEDLESFAKLLDSWMGVEVDA